MALETLKEIDEVGGFGILRTFSTGFSQFVLVDESKHAILFRLQNGPVEKHGVNGCQVDTIIEAAKLILEGLNKNFPCRENALAITKLDEALLWLGKRKADREKRGVEGKSLA